MNQKDIDKLWASRPKPTPKRDTAYGLINAQIYDKQAQSLLKTIRHETQGK